MSWCERAPGPFALWARFAPRAWPLPEAALFVDPFEGGLAAPHASARTALLDPPAEPEVVYLPPVAPERAAERDALAARIAAAGGHALAHLRPDETAPPAGATAVVDLLAPLVDGSEPAQFAAPAGAWCVVPLVAGLLEGDGERARWLGRLAELRAAAAVGVALALAPAERRRLAERTGEARWSAIFHGAAPSERGFARAAAAAGVAPLPPRPEVRLPPRAARNRSLATALAEAGELWLRLGRGEAEGEALLAGARRLASAPLDFAALAREGNLAVVDWLAPRARRLIEEELSGARGERAALGAEWSGEASG